MSEKRFIVESVMITYDCNEDKRIVKVITDKEELYSYDDLYEISGLLNEQQATNDYLEESNSRLQVQLGETLRLVDEQQATINRLEEENEQLRKELNDCEKFRYTIFKRMEELNDERRTKRN